ncbi:glycerophosphodiester phosphodiesterase [Kibdelosporangium phytohabitans]|uniref:glycerophosphodiester phosphodiesterase n=1 Tax=Kibdelosporangium phytohabitans TaxID=860235 RepID=A0A0N9IH18_9PSEU|nr:glycerophosphodiester phosphodiesterase [Kibdelosporangium phytohabitans]ALG14253.1 glycerophosphodiester phosphodiesterase [Kibdelosporangium phytohabitans]MBE1466744.1 glycerophosphoryl diester phosphodiesterase [Kibdelosporangium phytohabitans]
MGKRLAALALSGIALVAMVGPATADPQAQGGGEQAKPLIFGHRGASGYRPEHTLASYELAARMGADYIEPDLVSTKDGVLVARHENEIGGTTDVAARPEFAGRKTTKNIDGAPLTGWFTEDFTLAELKTLRATERIPDIRQRNTIYNKRFEVPTFQEVIELSRRLSWELHREIGIAPETKHPTYFQSIGKALEPGVVRTLDRNGLNHPRAKVVVQSFEVGNLVSLNRQLRVQLVQLTSATGAPYDFVVKGDPRTYADIVSPAGLRDVAKYADWLGPEKAQIIPRDAAGFLKAPTSLVADAHKAGLKVVPYTFRNENSFLPADFRSSAVAAEYGNAFGEFEKFFATGVDGVFTDNTDTAVEARKNRR